MGVSGYFFFSSFFPGWMGDGGDGSLVFLFFPLKIIVRAPLQGRRGNPGGENSREPHPPPHTHTPGPSPGPAEGGPPSRWRGAAGRASAGGPGRSGLSFSRREREGCAAAVRWLPPAPDRPGPARPGTARRGAARVAGPACGSAPCCVWCVPGR